MMKNIRVFAAILSLICLVFLSEKTQTAQAFTLPKPLKHAGLIFQEPLPEGIGFKYLTINEGPFQTIDFNPEESKPLALTLEPSPSPVSQVSEVSITESEVVDTPTPTPSPTATPTPTIIASSPAQSQTTGSNTSTGGGLNADILFNMSNTYRAGLGLPAFQKDERVCSLAAARAPEIGAEIAGGYMHAGKDSHGFPYWFTENIITMRTEAEAFNWWINDYIHRVQIVANNTHSCVACSGNACAQEFTSFQPK
jgi:uncharacterized protein YkwD